MWYTSARRGLSASVGHLQTKTTKKQGSVKIGGVYILSRRSIARMIATITAALMSLYAAVYAQAQNTVRRIHDATISLVSLDR